MSVTVRKAHVTLPLSQPVLTDILRTAEQAATSEDKRDFDSDSDTDSNYPTLSFTIAIGIGIAFEPLFAPKDRQECLSYKKKNGGR